MLYNRAAVLWSKYNAIYSTVQRVCEEKEKKNNGVYYILNARSFLITCIHFYKGKCRVKPLCNNLNTKILIVINPCARQLVDSIRSIPALFFHVFIYFSVNYFILLGIHRKLKYCKINKTTALWNMVLRLLYAVRWFGIEGVVLPWTALKNERRIAKNTMEFLGILTAITHSLLADRLSCGDKIVE